MRSKRPCWSRDGKCLLCNAYLTDAHLMTENHCKRMRRHVADNPGLAPGSRGKKAEAARRQEEGKTGPSSGAEWKPTLSPLPRRPDPTEEEARALVAAQVTSSNLAQDLAALMRIEAAITRPPSEDPPEEVKGEEPGGLSVEGVRDVKEEKPEGRFGPGEESSGSTRRLVPKSGVKINAPKVGLLKAIASADTKSWEGLQRALESSPGTGTVKSQLVQDLERIAGQRKSASQAVTAEVFKQAQRVKELEERDTEYLKALDEQGDQMRRLEQANPVKPSLTAKPLRSARLDAAIAAGTPIWVARKQEKSRRRAQLHRAEQTAALAGERIANEPEPGEPTPEALDERMQESARESLRDFQRQLEKSDPKPPAKRAPDSQRHKKIKKQRRRERDYRRKHDDADRDSNHAIAHVAEQGPSEGQCRLPPEDRFGPGDSTELALTSFPFLAKEPKLPMRDFKNPTRQRRELSRTPLDQHGPKSQAAPAVLFRPREGPTVVCVTPKGSTYHSQTCPRILSHERKTMQPCAVCRPDQVMPDPYSDDAQAPFLGRAKVSIWLQDPHFHSPSCALVRPVSGWRSRVGIAGPKGTSGTTPSSLAETTMLRETTTMQ